MYTSNVARISWNDFVVGLSRLKMALNKRFSVSFNAAKSACLFVSRRQRRTDDLQFYIDGNAIPFVNEYTHLGHVISTRMEDKSDIHLRRNSLCGKN